MLQKSSVLTLGSNGSCGYLCLPCLNRKIKKKILQWCLDCIVRFVGININQKKKIKTLLTLLVRLAICQLFHIGFFIFIINKCCFRLYTKRNGVNNADVNMERLIRVDSQYVSSFNANRFEFTTQLSIYIYQQHFIINEIIILNHLQLNL